MEKTLSVKKAKGFTLIELIVVIGIIGILASILVPYLLGYVQKARIAAVTIEAKNVYTAAAGTCLEQYALNPTYLEYANQYKDEDGEPCGFVTNWMLSSAQNKYAGLSYDRTKDKGADMPIAESVLRTLESEDLNNATYIFHLTYNPHGMTVSDYQAKAATQSRGQAVEPGVVICYLPEGYVKYIEYGRNGIHVHVSGGEVIVTKNGKFVNRTEN